MAKRFIDTAVLKHHFTRSLPASMKLLWVHLLTDCNYAGMWQVDWEIASVVVGSKIDPVKAEKFFGNKIVKLKGGAIWFMPDFIDFQYGKLNPKVSTHRNIILLLKKEKLINDEGDLEPLPKGSVTLTEGLQDKDKDKDKDNKGVQGEKEIFEEIEHPYLNKIRHEFPILNKLKFPLTQKEAERLEVDIGDDEVYRLLSRLANWDKITKRNSVNLTLRDWYKADLQKNKNDNSNQNKSEQKFGRQTAAAIDRLVNGGDIPEF